MLLERLHRGLFKLSRFGVWVCGAALLAASLLVFAEVLARNFLGSRVSGSGEIAGYIFAVSVTWGFSFCLFERSHVRIDFIYQRLPALLRSLFDWLGLVTMLVFSSVLASKAWGTFTESLAYESVSTTHLQTPLWIPQAAWMTGFILFSLNAAFLVVHAGVRLAQGRHHLVRDVAGVPNTHR